MADSVRGARALLVAWLPLLAAAAYGCGSNERDGKADGGTGAASGTGTGATSSTGAGANPGTGGSISLGSGAAVGSGGANSNGAGGAAVEPGCAGEVTSGKAIPLDIYVMLDASGSMLGPAGNSKTVTKWDAVNSALTSFMTDPKSAGIGVGLQSFPQRDPAAPASCVNDAACGKFGPCLTKLCWDTQTYCIDDSDCGRGDDCVTFGECALDKSYICSQIGSTCSDGLGQCTAPASECLMTGDCRATTYAKPAAAIASLPEATTALIGALKAATPTGDGLTPTGPALAGAVSAASEWATAHPDHRVVVLLATDGLPTECTPVEIPQVSQLAANALSTKPSISTFVIGVVADTDGNASANLNAIAVAGGTKQAFIVKAEGDVNGQFLAALAEIRGSRLACEYEIPGQSEGKRVDYELVNVRFDDGTGPRVLGYVGSAAECDAAEGGWHYDAAPVAGTKPTRIVACPSTCARFEAAATGSVDIQVGCKTIVQ